MNKNKHLWMLLPHRGVATGKSRLSAVLDDAARSELNGWLLARTLRVAGAWLGDAQRCAVVSPCAQTRVLAVDAGAMPLAEPAPCRGLNDALAHGMSELAARGAQRVLILPCDLPLLETAALQAMLALSDVGAPVVLAPDRHGTGTNAMLVDAGARTFAFGADSLARHQKTSEAQGARVAICAQPALAFDLDTAEDFAWWLRSGAAVPLFAAARPVSV